MVFLEVFWFGVVNAILTNNPALCKYVIDGYESNVMNVVHRVRSAFSFL